MKDIGYIVVNAEQIVGPVRRRPPRLEPGEIAIRLVLEVPDEYFLKHIPSAFLTIQPPIEPRDVTVDYDDVMTPDPLDRLIEEAPDS